MGRSNPKFSIFTHSLGACDQHPLPAKLLAASLAGFHGVEIFQADLDHHSSLPQYTSLFPGDAWEAKFEREKAAARDVAKLCRELGLEVVCLQPLRDIPGLVDPEERERVWKYALSRFDIMDILSTPLVLLCSSIRPQNELLPLPAHLDDYAAEIGAFADEAAKRGKKVALEGLCWGTTFDTVGQAWEIVKRADRDNLGVCFDSFNALGREWADPCSPTGHLPSPSARLSSLLSTLLTIPPSKIFLLQLADARPPPHPLPLSPSPTEPRPSRMIWSRSSRLFPFEEAMGGFMPVWEVCERVLNEMRWEGEWWSLEVFNDSLSKEGEEVPREHAQRGITSLRRLKEELDRSAGEGGDVAADIAAAKGDGKWYEGWNVRDYVSSLFLRASL